MAHDVRQSDRFRQDRIAGVVALVLLGGEFWDKLRALFVYDAKAQLPT